MRVDWARGGGRVDGGEQVTRSSRGGGRPPPLSDAATCYRRRRQPPFTSTHIHTLLSLQVLTRPLDPHRTQRMCSLTKSKLSVVRLEDVGNLVQIEPRESMKRAVFIILSRSH